MRLVVKYGGLTIQTPKKIKIAAKQATNEAKKNQIIIVCSAIGDTTDLLLKISQLVRKNDVNGAKTLAASIINLHKKTAQQTISKATGRKKLLDLLADDFTEFLALVDGITLLHEITKIGCITYCRTYYNYLVFFSLVGCLFGSNFYFFWSLNCQAAVFYN